MPMQIKVTSSIKKQVAEGIELYDRNTQRHLDRVANHLRNQVLLGMKNTQTDTTKGSPRGNKMHYPSKAGYPPAIDTGRLINSIHVMRAMPFRNGDKHSASVQTNVFYAKGLEEGIFHEARPFMGSASVAYKNTEQYAEAIASDISIKRSLPKPAKGVRIK